VLASFVFYGWWDWRFLFLIIGSGLIDYFAGLFIIKYPKRKTIFLIFSLIGNLGSLAAFKYSGFFAENLNYIAKLLGYNTDFKQYIPEFFWILPVGISFYTFQSMSYTIDIYRNRLKPTKNILLFFSYLSLFPQLVAGPIVRARDLLPQLSRVRKVSHQENWHGFQLILTGYFKKVVIADNIAPFVNHAFSNINTSNSSIYWWVVMLGFALQIYADFSGYSDIARGLAKWMGLHFKMNFNHPYISTSLKEFWTRWHISLSTWFRDYVYIPLGGSRKGKFRSHINMWITMIVSGFWHGAAWTFIIWGALHAFYLSFERIFKYPKILKKSSLGKIVLLNLVMFQVLIAWVFFRAENFYQAINIIKNMISFDFNLDWGNNFNYHTAVFYIVFGILTELYFFFNIESILKLSRNKKSKLQLIQFAVMILLILFFRGKGTEFIYFQF
jgi:D-alanyl-lipoteichoic acid acyltransferase DltB (MBOAT superfamily)